MDRGGSRGGISLPMSALVQLVQEACVFDGDDGLGGEVLHQLDPVLLLQRGIE